MTTSIYPEIPPLRVIEAALRTTTERLALELAQPAQAAPDWSQFEWLVARAVAAMHGVSALLSRSLRWQGPPAWREFIWGQKAQTVDRHARIEALLRLIDRAAAGADFPAVALKGAELHAMGLYEPGERPMGDVDLLVRSTDLERATHLLESLGFQESCSTRRHRLLIPTGDRPPPGGLGEHADNYLKIELHERVAESLPLTTVDVTEQLYPTQFHPGLNRYPSKAALMSHLLLHAAGSMATRSLRLLQLHDIALLSARMTDADWDQALRPSDAEAPYWWACPLILMTARYYPISIPARVLVAAQAGCPHLLGRFVRRSQLSDVSLSSLRIEAFPGIEWSQSPSEAARYVASRVLPSREVRQLRSQVEKTRISAAATRWQQLSQVRRMLLWLATPQPRAETIYPICLSLSEAQKRSPEATG
jgi:hypothetical protein